MQNFWNLLDAPQPDLFASDATGHRYRAEFRIWHENGLCHYAMYQPGTKQPKPIGSFPPACQRIQQAMQPLLQAINEQPELARRLFSVEFLATLSDQLLITLIYHRPIDANWDHAAQPLQALLNARLIGRSRKRRRVLDCDFLEEVLPTSEGEFCYRQVEGSFTQPNAPMACQMIDWVLAQVGKVPTDLLELYCGNGTFTLPLTRRFRQVLATELSKTGIQSLNWSIGANRIENLACARLSAEELVQAIDGVRPFRRLRDINLDSYDFSHLFVDPPRAGLDNATRAFASRFDRVIYISCNPQTLQRDLEQLTQTHRIARCALFDQFPLTPHIESGALLCKK